MRYWSVLFALVSVLAVATFVYAPFDDDWWLPSYRATNAQSIATLEEIQSQAPRAAASLVPLRDLDGPATPEQLETVEQTRAWLSLQSARLNQAIHANFLTTRSRALESQAAQTRAAVIEARNLLGAPEGAEAIDQAVSELGRFEAMAGDALATVVEPGGSLRATVSTAAGQIDHLYILLLVITGLTFIGVAIALVVVLWRFRAQPGRRAHYSHGSLRLEIIWTVIPAAILVFIALYQLRAWADIKFQSTWPDVRPLAEVTARQFQWKIRYPGPDGRFGTSDDLHTINDLHFVKDEPTIIHLKAEDVIHSFFLPQLRIKQDAVPGMTIPVLFDARKAGRYELLCAELCGWGHYKMRAQVIVHESQDEFDEWMAQSLREQDSSDPTASPASADVATASGLRVE
ncbi:cytochrome c oxidase subunit II [Tautonia marina]|uniref:cytochrome c oxidase subunit II n=1 Tax=Tautonia marina TaxID=2653855 RepID=UPI001F1C401C|nr:cytochrome c oxidase subunit II [Tautonia marina]